MVALRYRDEHNKVGYLLKPTGSDDYHQNIDFLRASYKRYALTHNPIIFDSLVKQFWSTAILRSPELGPPAIQATIDKNSYTITEDFVRSRLQLADDGGIDDLPITEIYYGMDNLGYVTEGKLTFFKNKFSPQWRFLVHTILHCLSTKSGCWDQFGSSLVVALICLSDGRRFNWSSYIFKGMVSNIGNVKKFLMYPRFLQAILGIEPRVKRHYKVLQFSSKLFANIRLNFEGPPMPFLPAMLAHDHEGKGAGVAAQAVPQHMPAPDQPQDHLSTPPRQQTSDPNALAFELGQSSDPNLASFLRTHETDDSPFTNVEDEPLGGSFHMSPPRSTQAPPVGQTSGGTEDHITLTALSYVVSTLLQKVNSLETELKDHKQLFKDVVGKLVKKVKALEVQLRTKKRKMVVSDSDQEKRGKQDVDLDALRALANAAVTVDSNIPPGGASNNPTARISVPAAVPTGASTVPIGALTVPTESLSVPADVPPSVSPAGVSNKVKSLMVYEDITVKERTFKQMQEDKLGEQAAKRLHDEEQAQVDRQEAELQRRRQQEVLALRSRMAALIKRKKQDLAKKLVKERRNRPMTQAQQRTYMRQFVKNQSCVVYSTGWKEFEKIRKAQSNIQIQAFSRTLKRTGLMLEEPSSKRQKSTEAPISSVPEVPHSPVVSSPTSSGTRRKSLGRKRLTKPKSKLQELDLDADDQTFLKVVSNEDSDDEAPILWSVLFGWEVISTPLGDINALYKMDRSTKHFTTLRQIIHMVDRQDLVKLYGLVVKYYKTHPVAGAGLILWSDLQVLFESHEGGKGSFVWQNQHLWEIQSWRLSTLSNVHVLETISGEVVYMFADVSHPLSVKLIELMLKHKLEIDKDVVGNDMTTDEQLIQFIKNQLAAA
nr:synaptobrevin, longin-like domain protein [Tanacetum cinerariifolium]